MFLGGWFYKSLSVIFLFFSIFGYSAAEGGFAWGDDFSTDSLNPLLWKIHTDIRDSALQAEKSVFVEDGVLKIRTFSENGVTYTGFLSTRELYRIKYGKLSARIRFFGAPGQHCAFWLQSPTVEVWRGDTRNSGVEIDIVENRHVDALGNSVENIALFNLHWGGYGKNHQTTGASWFSDAPLKEWHVYMLKWTPDAYYFYVDGVERWRHSGTPSGVFEEVRLSCEVGAGKGWAGALPKNGYPHERDSMIGMDVDWIKYFPEYE